MPLERYKDLIDLVFRRPNSADLALPVPLAELLDVSKLNTRDLPKQHKIDPMVKLIESKVLRQVHLPTSFRDLHGPICTALISAIFICICYKIKTLIIRGKSHNLSPWPLIICYWITYCSRLRRIGLLRRLNLYYVFRPRRSSICYIISIHHLWVATWVSRRLT